MKFDLEALNLQVVHRTSSETQGQLLVAQVKNWRNERLYESLQGRVKDLLVNFRRTFRCADFFSLCPD